MKDNDILRDRLEGDPTIQEAEVILPHEQEGQEIKEDTDLFYGDETEDSLEDYDDEDNETTPDRKARNVAAFLLPVLFLPFLPILREHQIMGAAVLAVLILYPLSRLIGKEGVVLNVMPVAYALLCVTSFLTGQYLLFVPTTLLPFAIAWTEGESTDWRLPVVGCITAIISFLIGDVPISLSHAETYFPLMFAVLFPIIMRCISLRTEAINFVESESDNPSTEEDTLSALYAVERQNALLYSLLGLGYSYFSYKEIIKSTIDTLFESEISVFALYYIFDKSKDRFELAYAKGSNPAASQRVIPSGKGIVGRTSLTGEYVFIRGMKEKEKREEVREALGELDSVVCAPVIVDGQVSAAIYYGFKSMGDEEQGGMIQLICAVAERVGGELQKLKSHEEVKEEGERDKLTGLYNRQFFDVEIERAFNESMRTGTKLAYAEIDLDYFKQMNDTHGHDFGDKVLKTAADVFTKTVRPEDYVFRVGGDEFGLMFKGLSEDEMFKALKRIRDNYTKEVEEKKLYAKLDGKEVKSSLSIGAAVAPHAGINSAGELMKLADKALYYVKGDGKNGIVIAK